MEERMTVDRRSFFKGGILATLFAGIPGAITTFADVLQKKPTRASAPRLFRPKSSDNLARLSMDSFSPFIDTPFTLRGVGVKMSSVSVILTRVADLRKSPSEIALANQGRELFSLEFTGPNSNPLPQGMYAFSNASLGTFNLMVVPGTSGNRDATYQATVNRLYS